MFFESNRQKGKKSLDAVNNKIRQKDAIRITFFAGCFLTTLMFLVYIASLPRYPGSGYIYASEDTYMFTFIMIFILFAVAVNIQVMRKFSVNYTFIFEID